MKIDFSNYKKILFAPLNWGLGHASRCMPLIDLALSQGKEVAIASDGLSLDLLQKEYPSIQDFELPSYNINYKGSNLIFSLFKQSIKINKAIKAEKLKAELIIQQWKPDLIISDNRYGVYNSNVKSILISHQLNPYHKISSVRWLGTQIINKLIHPFNEIWVPDFKDRRLSGILSKSSNPKVKFIGPLTRLKIKEKNKEGQNILIINSGPEPTRTQFENLILETLKGLKNLVLIRGSLSPCFIDLSTISVKHLDLANRNEILEEIINARLIITRSGYSSLMDLYDLSINKIIIATPGQTEQEYLSEKIDGKFKFYSLEQKQIQTSLVELIDQLY